MMVILINRRHAVCIQATAKEVSSVEPDPQLMIYLLPRYTGSLDSQYGCHRAIWSGVANG